MAMTSTERARKHRAKKQLALKKKYESAQEKGITVIEGGILAYQDRDFVVYQWSTEAGDYVVTHRGWLDRVTVGI